MQTAEQTSIEPPDRTGASEAADLRALLRAGTRASHEALDARFDAMTASPDDGLYRRFVAMNALAFAGLVPLLAASPLAAIEGAIEPLEAGRAALAADMAAMGVPSPRALPAPPIPRPDLAEAAGIAYVLEGSKLGARYLHRLILDPGGRPRWPGASTAYLAEAGAGRPFPAYLALLAGTGVEASAALRAAGATFGHFAAVLEAIESEAPSSPDTRTGKAK